MERKITQRLKQWKSRPDRKPLMLFGARQTGKTTSVLDFGKGEYERVVHVDLLKQPQMKTAFQGGLEPEIIVAAIEALGRCEIDPGSTLLFLDEVQECDAAITALKYFCSDLPRLDVVAAGSLLGVHVAREGSFPVGYVDTLTMRPMDFEEFCWAIDERKAFDLVKLSHKAMTACPVHDRMMELYRSYLLVGGHARGGVEVC